MVKIDAPGRLVVLRASVEERIGRSWDPQEIHMSLVSLSGNVDESDESFSVERLR
jgi:phenol hydroxylase P2 protein